MVKKIAQSKLIFIHGYTASSKADWYSALKPMMDKLKIDYSIPDLPGNKKPHSKEWLKIIHDEVSNTDKPIVLIGHSLGTRAVLLYLDKYKTNVEQAMLIAPLSNNTKNADRRDGEAYPDFFEYKIDLKKVKKLSKKWLILHSKDDSSLNYEDHGASLSNEMSIRLKTFERRDHFTKPEDAKYILDALLEEIN